MDVLLFLIPLAVLIALLGVLGIFWSVKNNQYDDLKMNSEKILYNESKKHE
ncbi:MAG: cbb3-type cytochrome oxidase assembly protein CcoS [Candidatus Midichloriaceae bacterium]